MGLLKFIKKYTGLELKLTPKMIFLNVVQGITNNAQRKILKKAIPTAIYVIFKIYYSRKGMISSSWAGCELKRNLCYTFQNDFGKIWNMDLDPRIDNSILTNEIRNTPLLALRNGEKNLAIWRRGLNASLIEPNLELTSDYASIIKPSCPPMGKKVSWRKLELLLLDNK